MTACACQTCRDVPDFVNELTAPYRHKERHLVRKRRRQIARLHHTDHPSLLDQLRQAATPGTTEDLTSRTAESAPPAVVGALDALMRIEAAAADWTSRRLRLTLRRTTEGNIRLLGTKLDQGGHNLGEHIERWWRWARVESAWDGRPRDLRDPCPICGERMLRVAWDVSAAWCRADGCGATWGAGELGILGAMLDTQRAQRA